MPGTQKSIGRPAVASTVGELIEQVFPYGTTYSSKPQQTRAKADYRHAPLFPFDLFAVTGLLLLRGAAYQKIVPEGTAKGAPKGSLVVKLRDMDRLRKIGRAWSLNPKMPDDVQDRWTKLMACAPSPLFQYSGASVKQEPWWRTAFELMVIADEASEDVGYWPTIPPGDKIRWPVELAAILLNGEFPKRPSSRHIKLSRNRPSLTSAAVNQDIVCVQPKARTPDVGCCMRNLTHNLALLPPRGVMRVHWMTPPCAQGQEEAEALNILLIPFPYKIDPSWFVSERPTTNPWHWFDLRQQWLNVGTGVIIEFVRALLAKATSKQQIHSVVFPEYSLDWNTYEKLAEVLRDEYPTVQFLVSGASKNCIDEEGNFAIASHFFEDRDPIKGTKARMMATVSRPKHHRWALSADQIAAYNLESEFELNGDTRWWERIPLQPREIYVNAMRSASVFSAMICEDLARTEPAHEPLRAVGPNLVFVLLMDGPQLQWRWAARYSMGLADDPGCSVLTLTSRALVARWNKKREPKDQSWSIGLWKDEANRAFEINCHEGVEAIVLKLEGKRQVEVTLDGRSNDQTFAWHRLDDMYEVSLDRDAHGALLNKLGLH